MLEDKITKNEFLRTLSFNIRYYTTLHPLPLLIYYFPKALALTLYDFTFKKFKKEKYLFKQE